MPDELRISVNTIRSGIKSEATKVLAAISSMSIALADNGDLNLNALSTCMSSKP